MENKISKKKQEIIERIVNNLSKKNKISKITQEIVGRNVNNYFKKNRRFIDSIKKQDK